MQLVRIGLNVLLSIALFGLSTGTVRSASRVVMVTLDAGSDATVKNLLARGVLPAGGAFARMMAHGTWAGALDPVNVSSTPIVHASLYSGTLPSAHGIIGVSIPVLGGDIRASGEENSGFTAPLEQERIWTHAARYGKRVTCIFAPGAGARRKDDTCTFHSSVSGAVFAGHCCRDWQRKEPAFDPSAPWVIAAS